MTKVRRMKFRLVLTACCIAALFALPSAASAGSCAPPGNSGVDQYFETVPGAGCNQGPGGSGGGGNNGGNGHNGGGGGGTHLSPSTNHQLASQGAAGRAVQRLVSSTAPTLTGSNANHQTGSKQRGKNQQNNGVSGAKVTIPSAPGRGLIAALLHPILSGSTSSGGTGLVLPILLAAILVAAIGALILRRRRISSNP